MYITYIYLPSRVARGLAQWLGGACNTLGGACNTLGGACNTCHNGSILYSPLRTVSHGSILYSPLRTGFPLIYCRAL